VWTQNDKDLQKLETRQQEDKGVGSD
jgi:hypothetical protein